jgi:hypothetical protein
MKQSKAKGSGQRNGVVEFDYENTSYQIDPQRRKVYRKWIEVESARTFLIMSAWSSFNADKKTA